MTAKVVLTGDVNLMNIEDPRVPFRRVTDAFRAADLVIANLECCLYAGGAVTMEGEGFLADPVIAGEALRLSGIGIVGIANNVNFGTDAILSSLARLDELNILHAGAGPDGPAARQPVIATYAGTRIAFLQRSSVYWPTNHEAGADAPGIAVVRAHTAYQVPMYRARPGIPPMNRPGIPPTVLTWVDPAYGKQLRDDIEMARAEADCVIVGCHWGLGTEILDYMTEIAHLAIDAGASAVVGHGPHYSLPVEVYRGKPIFYGVGSFSFHTGHRGRKHPDWLGMMPELILDGAEVAAASFSFVRHNASNETFICSLDDELPNLAELTERSAPLGAGLGRQANAVHLNLRSR